MTRRVPHRVCDTYDLVIIGGGSGGLVAPTTIEVDGRSITSTRFVVATGARPTVPPISGLRELAPLTNENLFDLPRRPESMIVLGGGPIGCEMAQAFARLGTRIKLVEALDRILPREEPDASEVITEALADDGVDVRTGAKVVRVERLPGGQVCVHSDDGRSVAAERLLVAMGRTPSGCGLGLEEIGVEVDGRGAVVVDAAMATTVEGIWAVGDVTGGLRFTHAAGRMGWVAVANALSSRARVRTFRFDASAVPWATFTSPEVGRVGLTEAEAAELHSGARVAHLPLEHVDRAVAVGGQQAALQFFRPVSGRTHRPARRQA